MPDPCRMGPIGMSALGWEPPLDAICTNGSNAQEVYFAKSRDRPKAFQPQRFPLTASWLSAQTRNFGW
jgi:hypothetical protein